MMMGEVPDYDVDSEWSDKKVSFGKTYKSGNLYTQSRALGTSLPMN
jgi:hypothetical protein